MPSQLMQSRALKLLSKVEVEEEVDVEVEVVGEVLLISVGSRTVSVAGVVEVRMTVGSTGSTDVVGRAGVEGMSLCALSPVAVPGEQLLDL